jgi:haloacetate dehalogenase
VQPNFGDELNQSSLGRSGAADKDRQIGMPLLILWGTRGAPPTQEYPTIWRKYASNLVDAQPLPTGHYLQEEAPDQVVDHFIKFFTT